MMGIFYKRPSKDIEFKEERVENTTKAPLIIYDEKTRETILIEPGQSKIILKAIPLKFPRKVEIEIGQYEE